MDGRAEWTFALQVMSAEDGIGSKGLAKEFPQSFGRAGGRAAKRSRSRPSCSRSWGARGRPRWAWRVPPVDANGGPSLAVLATTSPLRRAFREPLPQCRRRAMNGTGAIDVKRPRATAPGLARSTIGRPTVPASPPEACAQRVFRALLHHEGRRHRASASRWSASRSRFTAATISVQRGLPGGGATFAIVFSLPPPTFTNPPPTGLLVSPRVSPRGTTSPNIRRMVSCVCSNRTAYDTVRSGRWANAAMVRLTEDAPDVVFARSD